MMTFIDKKPVYVVDFDTMPELPIYGRTPGELAYDMALRMAGGRSPDTRGGLYAKALNDAIETGVITEPGKYAIHLVRSENRYEIYRVIE